MAAGAAALGTAYGLRDFFASCAAFQGVSPLLVLKS
jgi:hypothetical protein